MKNFYISDNHWCHKNVLKFDNRPFDTVEDMDEKMIVLWNETVSKNDIVHILGDFCWEKEPKWIELLNKLNGRCELIIGNHDLKQMSTKLKSKFADIKPYKEISDNGKRIIMCHYPIMCYKRSYDENTWMFHGHTHITHEQTWIDNWTNSLILYNQTNPNNSNNKGHVINVGCMMPYVNYIPRTTDELIKAWKKKYYKIY